MEAGAVSGVDVSVIIELSDANILLLLDAVWDSIDEVITCFILRSSKSGVCSFMSCCVETLVCSA